MYDTSKSHFLKEKINSSTQMTRVVNENKKERRKTPSETALMRCG